ncbi:MAG: RNA methyltransferase [Bacteroidales bacterium]|nr:RNA methyltransferase [Bacteroidales bacterium]
MTNSEIKHISSLKSKKNRAEAGEFVVESEKLVAEAIASGFEVKKVFYCGDGVDGRITSHPAAEPVDLKTMDRISLLSSPSPALAVLGMPPAASADELSALASNPGTLCLALDGVRDPGNLGTIIRIADWFGIDAVLASPDTVELYNPKTIQSTMGSVFRKKVIYCDLAEAARLFSDAGAAVYGTFLEGEDIRIQKLERHALVIMGSESFGIRDYLAESVTRKLFIPPYPAGGSGCESLNVSAAAAVVCSEFRRFS